MSKADDDYVPFKELMIGEQNKAIKAYAGMLFDMETPRWWKGVGESEVSYSSYQQMLMDLNTIYRASNRGGNWQDFSRFIEVAYKNDSDQMKKRNWNRPRIDPKPVITFTAEGGFHPSNIVAGTQLNKSYGVLNHTDNLFFYAEDWGKKWIDAITHISNEATNALSIPDSHHMKQRGLGGDALNDLTKQLEAFSSELKSILTCRLPNESPKWRGDKPPSNEIIRWSDDLMGFALNQPISSDTHYLTYMEANAHYQSVNRMAEGPNSVYRNNMTLPYYNFYLNMDDHDHRRQKQPMDSSLLMQYGVLIDSPYKPLYHAFEQLRKVAYEGIGSLVSAISSILQTYAKSLADEVAKRTHQDYFSKWADGKGLRFHHQSGVMFGDKVIKWEGLML